MYTIHLYGKILKNQGKFFNYDDARNAARRFIRNSKNYQPWGSNPALGAYGIRVIRKA